MTMKKQASVTIRPATEGDIPAILAIRNQGIEDRIATLDAAPHTLEEETQWFRHHGASEPILVPDARINN